MGGEKLKRLAPDTPPAMGPVDVELMQVHVASRRVSPGVLIGMRSEADERAVATP